MITRYIGAGNNTCSGIFLLLIVAAPSILIFLFLNGWRYYKFKKPMDLALLITWTWLGMVIGAYFTYLQLEITPQLWRRGIWFSENDVLHIGPIRWNTFIAIFVARRIVDAPSSVSSPVEASFSP